MLTPDRPQVVENVQAISGGEITHGTLRLTDFHLVFCAPAKPAADTAEAKAPPTRERWIPYPLISRCALRPVPFSSAQAPTLRLRCRDFSFITFNLVDNDVARDLYEFIKTRTSKLRAVDKLYAFKHRPLKHEKEVNGWHFYDPKAEFKRQGISEKLAEKGWRVTHINKDHSFSETYPAFLVVPSAISDNTLKYAKDFRTHARLPVLTYLHPVNNCAITRSSQCYAGITRKGNIQDEKLVAASFSAFIPGASEDTTPVTSQGDVAAEDGSGSQLDVSETAPPERDMMYTSSAQWDEKTGERRVYGAQQMNLIVDARPRVNAMVNQAQGMGSENMEKYKFASKVFLNIGNIHVMRNSLDKVIDAIKDADITKHPPSQELLYKSDWLRHIHAVMEGSALVARRVGTLHSNVLIHCSDGWDRTSQVSALSQIMLDPFFRTIEGFITLVEKDWLSFGHMFRLRSGHLNHEDWFTIQKDAYAGTKVQPGEQDGRNDAFQSVFSRFLSNVNKEKDNTDLEAISDIATGEVVKEELTVPKMVSPIFHQFLDSTFQLLRQHPTRFEFTERFLRRLLYHLYSCQYGTFLYNSEKQRKDARVAERTSSVWDYFLSRKAEFINPEYSDVIDDHVKGQERMIFPKLEDIRWWHQLFGRTYDEMNGDLDAAAASASDRQAAFSSLYPFVSQPPEEEPRSSSASSRRPGLTASQSVLSGTESPHQALTPKVSEPSLQRSMSAEGEGLSFAAIREGIAGLGFGRDWLGGVARADEPSTPPKPPARSDQELSEMT